MIVFKNSSTEKKAEIVVTQTAPTAPTLLTATDLKLGDSIRLVWSGGGPLYNVYYKKTSDSTFILAHPTPLAGATTQYDVGGLEVNVSYDFMLRGVNGLGTESANSNILTATPTLDLTQSKFATPTWSVKINSVTVPEAILTSVELGYGSDVSNAIFVIQRDPDESGFPSYNDSAEIIINGRTVLTGKIKGITSRISASGLTKTFTVISNMTKFQEKVVPITKSVFNEQTKTKGTSTTQTTVTQILQEVLGFIPSGTPSDSPGEVHLTDQTQLEATQTVLNKLGNFKLFFNQATELLEAYRFGQGGDVTRQFIKGQNIIDYNITENRQDVVDQLTLIGPPRALRRTTILDFTQGSVIPDSNGIWRLSFLLSGQNIRDIELEGFERASPYIEYQGNVQVLPEDMGFSPTFSSIPGFAEWPFVFNSTISEGSAKGDVGLRRAVKTLVPGSTVRTTVTGFPEYLSKDQVRIFIGTLPKVAFHTMKTALVDNKKVGIVGAGLQTSVQVMLSVVDGVSSPIANYTVDGDRPTFTVGSGTVQRSITDEQYQIVISTLRGEEFNNEAAVLALMQKRINGEFERLNLPKISGSVTVIGDETIDLKSTVLFGGTKLDVVKVVHNLTNGFTTQVALTNEPFVEAILETIPTQRESALERNERAATTDFRISFADIEQDQNIVTQRKQELQKRLHEAGVSFARYQD